MSYKDFVQDRIRTIGEYRGIRYAVPVIGLAALLTTEFLKEPHEARFDYKDYPELAREVEEATKAYLNDPKNIESGLIEFSPWEDTTFSEEEIGKYLAVAGWNPELERISNVLGDSVAEYQTIVFTESSGRHLDTKDNILKSGGNAYSLAGVKFQGSFLEMLYFVNSNDPYYQQLRQEHPEVLELLESRLKNPSYKSGKTRLSIWNEVKKDPVLNMEVGLSYYHITKDPGVYNTGPRGKKENNEAAERYAKKFRENKRAFVQGEKIMEKYEHYVKNQAALAILRQRGKAEYK